MAGDKKKVMAKKTRRKTEVGVQSPGSKIREELQARGMLQKEFALRMDMTEKHVSKLINGEVLLTTNVASRLAVVLGIPAATWNAMEASYREELQRIQTEGQMEADVELAQCFPYAEMAKLGWVPQVRTVKEKVLNLRSFFEVVELSLLSKWQLGGFAGRSLALHDKEDLTVMAWLQAARKKAREKKAETFLSKGLEEMVPEILEVTSGRPQGALAKLDEILNRHGIVLVFLPRIKGLSLQSATFQSGNRVVIAMTAKKMDDHEFWGRLFHELGHVFLGHAWQEEGTTEQDERDANLWARNALIPRKEYDAFRHAGRFTEQSICEFSARMGIAPGILVGRLQLDGLIGGGTLNRLKKVYDLEGEAQGE